MAGLDLSISSHSKTDNNNSLTVSLGNSDMDASPVKSVDSPASTPRKNKRKSSSPKRRSDFSIKRFCPDRPPALNLDTDEPLSRPGYGEHPPSTPETSASSSTPSPPDATELIRIPHVPRRTAGLTSPKRRHEFPSTSARSSSPPRTEPVLVKPPLISPYAAAAAAAAGAPAAFLPMNPLLLQHMAGLQAHPATAHALPYMLHQQQLTSAGQHAKASRLATMPPIHPSASGLLTHSLHGREHAASVSHPSLITMPASATSRHNSHGSTSRTSSSKAATTAATTAAVPAAAAATTANHRSRSNSAKLDVSATARSHTSTLSTSRSSEPSVQSDSEEVDTETGKKRKKFNYKNMTRERRIEANARERSRVHTISAAFETLRRSVPAFSHNQRLSKLAILRIACSYITSLATLAGHDYSADDGHQMTFEDSVNQCTKTIQNEGRAKRRH